MRTGFEQVSRPGFVFRDEGASNRGTDFARAFLLELEGFAATWWAHRMDPDRGPKGVSAY